MMDGTRAKPQRTPHEENLAETARRVAAAKLEEAEAHARHMANMHDYVFHNKVEWAPE